MVRRRHIWTDVQRCFRKDYTNLELPIRIVFVGEAGEDDGGPKREFFRLAILAATTDGNLYRSVQGGQIPVQNTCAVLQNSYAHTGWLIAMSITQGGPGPMCFAPWVYEYISLGYVSDLNIGDIPSQCIQQFLKQVCKHFKVFYFVYTKQSCRFRLLIESVIYTSY